MLDLFLEESRNRGYVVFYEVKGRPLNLNIVGWRRRQGELNHFCDFIAVYYQVGSEWVSRVWPAATRPGKPYLQNPLNKKGVAILKPGQYLQAYSLGLHRGYLALKQVKPVVVYRDDNRDLVWDLEKSETGHFGINIHKASVLSLLVNKHSAGCQVFKSWKDFDEFIGLCEDSIAFFGNKFTYTLLEF